MAQKRGLGISVVEESRFGNSRGLDNSSGLEQSFSAFQSHGKLVLGSQESHKRGFGNWSDSGRQAEAGRQAGRQAGRGKHKGRQGGR